MHAPPRKVTVPVKISIDGKAVEVNEGDLLIEAILREQQIPHVCYHSEFMGPIQTCDTCLVEVNGQLARACGTRVSAGMKVVAESDRARKARSDAFDVILGNHMLYCTVCDNNNEN
jgi:formate dehydrogenase major subunit